MKKTLLVAFVLAVAAFPAFAFATSGACSYHGGVNCSVESPLGNAICKDGSVSSVSYSDMAECKQTPTYCMPPVAGICTTSADLGRLQVQGYQSGAAQYDNSFSSLVASCQAAITSYQAQQLAYTSCLNSEETSYPPAVVQTAISCPAGFYLDSAGKCDQSTASVQPRDYAQYAQQQAAQQPPAPEVSAPAATQGQSAPTPAPVQTPVVQPISTVVPVKATPTPSVQVLPKASSRLTAATTTNASSTQIEQKPTPIAVPKPSLFRRIENFFASLFG